MTDNDSEIERLEGELSEVEEEINNAFSCELSCYVRNRDIIDEYEELQGRTSDLDYDKMHLLQKIWEKKNV